MRLTCGMRPGLYANLSGGLDAVDVLVAWVFAVVSVAIMFAVV